MENNKEERNVNLIIKNQDTAEREHLSVSISGIIKNLKRLFALWLAVTIIASLLTVLIGTLTNIKVYKETSALVSFTYSGIEKGLDPYGNIFDAYTIVCPEVLDKLNEDPNFNISKEEINVIRNSISIQGVVPQDFMEKKLSYGEIAEAGNGSSLAALEKLYELSYFPSQFKITFNYNDTPYDSQMASSILNKILTSYSEFFLKKYGYNAALGSAVATINYEDYDYAEAVDIFDSSLSSLRSYLIQLNKAQASQFRSTKTGVTFEDLIKGIDTIRNSDLDIISSYVTLNVVTKDPESLRTYYTYKIENLERSVVVCRENLAAVTDSIANYEKNTVQIFGAGTDSINTTAKEASAEYDRLFEEKLSAQNDLSTTVQRVNLYKTRLDRLNNQTVGTQQQKQKTEEDLLKLSEKIKEQTEVIRETATEYFETYLYARSFSIDVPASSSGKSFVIKAIKDSILIVIAIDILIFVAFFGKAVIDSCITEYNKKENNNKSEKKSKSEKSEK